MKKFFIYKTRTGAYYRGQSPSSFVWGLDKNEKALVSLEEAEAIVMEHNEKWGEELWIVLNQ